jgi:hypothetical protein
MQSLRLGNDDTHNAARNVPCHQHAQFQAKEGAKAQLPWGLALLFSVFTAIAATGSIFEFVDKNPIFGVIQVCVGVQLPLGTEVTLSLI